MPTRHVKKKEKKRCIPKEGMPHAHKACQKKERKDAYPKKVCHTPTRCVKKKRKKENIAHTKNITREREFI